MSQSTARPNRPSSRSSSGVSYATAARPKHRPSMRASMRPQRRVEAAGPLRSDLGDRVVTLHVRLRAGPLREREPVLPVNGSDIENCPNFEGDRNPSVCDERRIRDALNIDRHLALQSGYGAVSATAGHHGGSRRRPQAVARPRTPIAGSSRQSAIANDWSPCGDRFRGLGIDRTWRIRRDLGIGSERHSIRGCCQGQAAGVACSRDSALTSEMLIQESS